MPDKRELEPQTLDEWRALAKALERSNRTLLKLIACIWLAFAIWSFRDELITLLQKLPSVPSA